MFRSDLLGGSGAITVEFWKGFGTVWNGLERFGTVRNGSERFGAVWNGSERSGTVRNGLERSTLAGRISSKRGNSVEPFGTEFGL